MPTISSSPTLGALLKFEEEGFFSRDVVTVASGQNLVLGAVVAMLTMSSVVAAHVAGGTGDGAIGAVTLGANATPGVYTLVCTAVSANAGTFSVTTPTGIPLQPLTVGVAYTSSHINVTLADGATDFIVGDSITITVSGSGKVTALAPAAVNGAAQPVGVMLYDVDATDGDVSNAIMLARQAAVADSGLVWPAGITEPQQSVAEAQLKALGILIRQGV